MVGCWLICSLDFYLLLGLQKPWTPEVMEMLVQVFTTLARMSLRIRVRCQCGHKSSDNAGVGLCPHNWERFDPVGPNEVDRILGNVSIATCALDPCSPLHSQAG